MIRFHYHGKKGVEPQKMEEGSVGYDIAVPEEEAPVVLPYRSRRVIDTGLVVKPEKSLTVESIREEREDIRFFTMVVPRSSSYDQNIRISNTVGVIDPSYCGQDDTIKISLERGSAQYEFDHVVDLSKESVPSKVRRDTHMYKVERLDDRQEAHVFKRKENDPVVFEAGDRFCQMLFLPFVSPITYNEKLDFFANDGRGGFGSTGT
jgi:dUTPase